MSNTFDYVPPKLPVLIGNMSAQVRKLVSGGHVCPCNYPSVYYTMVWWTKAWNFIVLTLSHNTWALITLISPLQDHLKHDWWRLKAQRCHSHVAIRWTVENPVTLMWYLSSFLVWTQQSSFHSSTFLLTFILSYTGLIPPVWGSFSLSLSSLWQTSFSLSKDQCCFSKLQFADLSDLARVVLQSP